MANRLPNLSKPYPNLRGVMTIADVAAESGLSARTISIYRQNNTYNFPDAIFLVGDRPLFAAQDIRKWLATRGEIRRGRPLREPPPNDDYPPAA